MFNRSEILRSAWSAYRIARLGVFALGDGNGKRAFVRSLFARCLRRAWDAAKAEAVSSNAREAARLAAALMVKVRASQADLAARMAPEVRSARITSIRDELTVLEYASLNVRTGNRRTDLRAELSILETAGA